MNDRNPAMLKAEQELRASYAELCYWYPQYKLEDITGTPEKNYEDGLPLGDLNLLLNYARMQYYQDKFDTLTIVAAGNGGKKPYKNVGGKLQGIIKRIKARL